MKSENENQNLSFTEVLSLTAQKAVELANANSVLGTPVVSDGVTVIPVSKLSIGFAGGGADICDKAKSKHKSPAGAGAKVDVIPMNFLVISDDKARLIQIDNVNSGFDIKETVSSIIKLFKKNKKV